MLTLVECVAQIAKCLIVQPHIWRNCPFVHPSEPVQRRHPSLYQGDLCPAVKQVGASNAVPAIMLSYAAHSSIVQVNTVDGTVGPFGVKRWQLDIAIPWPVLYSQTATVAEHGVQPFACRGTHMSTDHRSFLLQPLHGVELKQA